MQTWAEVRAGRVVHSDDRVLVLDKPAGWSVMGERHDIDLVRLAQDAGVRLWPAHRIDKVTSGVVLFARDLATHGGLTRQFAQRTVDKTYLALTATTGLPASGRIELPLSVGRKNRVRVAAPREAIVEGPDPEAPDPGGRGGAGQWTVPDEAVFDDVASYPSTTTFERLWTGAGHTLVGDPLFGVDGARTGLHAWHLGFDEPSGARRDVRVGPGDDFWALAPDADPDVLPA